MCEQLSLEVCKQETWWQWSGTGAHSDGTDMHAFQTALHALAAGKYWMWANTYMVWHIWVCGDTGPNLAGPRRMTTPRGRPAQKESYKTEGKDWEILPRPSTNCCPRPALIDVSISSSSFFLKRRSHLALESLLSQVSLGAPVWSCERNLLRDLWACVSVYADWPPSLLNRWTVPWRVSSRMKTQKCTGLHMLLLLYVRLMLAVDTYRPQRVSIASLSIHLEHQKPPKL